MNAEGFRKIALGMEGAVEGSHMGHPDFRAKGKIFATLFWLEDGTEAGMVKLTPEQQASCMQAYPDVFSPIKGGWGLRGCTQVDLKAARVATLKPVMRQAHENLVLGKKRKD